MTIEQMYKRLGTILSEHPEYVDIPVELQSRKSDKKRSPSTYEPILFVSSCPLGFTDGSKAIIIIGDTHNRHGSVRVGSTLDFNENHTLTEATVQAMFNGRED